MKDAEALPSWKDTRPDFIGISLRDWFAGQALAGFCAADVMPSKPELVAIDAYELADAMLAAREQSQ